MCPASLCRAFVDEWRVMRSHKKHIRTLYCPRPVLKQWDIYICNTNSTFQGCDSTFPFSYVSLFSQISRSKLTNSTFPGAGKFHTNSTFRFLLLLFFRGCEETSREGILGRRPYLKSLGRRPYLNDGRRAAILRVLVIVGWAISLRIHEFSVISQSVQNRGQRESAATRKSW